MRAALSETRESSRWEWGTWGPQEKRKKAEAAGSKTGLVKEAGSQSWVPMLPLAWSPGGLQGGRLKRKDGAANIWSTIMARLISIMADSGKPRCLFGHFLSHPDPSHSHFCHTYSPHTIPCHTYPPPQLFPVTLLSALLVSLGPELPPPPPPSLSPSL